MTTFRAELVFLYKRGLQSLPSPCQRRFAGVPRDFSSLNKPTHFLAESLADYGWGDICQRGIARTPCASHFLDDGELKWEVDVCIFPPFPFLSFPLLLTSLSQSITGGLMDAPAPPKTSLRSQPRQAGKGFGLNLSREVLGQQQVPINAQIAGAAANRWCLCYTNTLCRRSATRTDLFVLGYLHILPWKPHSYLGSVTVTLGIPPFPTWLLAAPRPPVLFSLPLQAFQHDQVKR